MYDLIASLFILFTMCSLPSKLSNNLYLTPKFVQALCTISFGMERLVDMNLKSSIKQLSISVEEACM